MKLNLLVSLAFIGHLLSAQTFTESPQMPPFVDVYGSSIAFSDVDGDNDQDVLITGRNSSFTRISKLYTNDGMGNFTERIGTPFVGVEQSSIAFSDVDGDNDQDVLITGSYSSITPISKLYINDGMGNFTERTGAPFVNVAIGSIAFSDVDGDNDQDVLITGGDSSFIPISKLYINDGMGNFIEKMGTPFEGVFQSFIAFSDVDGDNDQDVLITGFSRSSGRISKLYTNDGMGNFIEKMGTPFDGVQESSIAFSDVDGDNDQDVLITGFSRSSGRISKLYTNDGMGNFIEKMGTPFERVSGSIAFSDVDGDNDQDVLITGSYSSITLISKLYINDGMGNFTERTGTPFEGVNYSSIAFSDVDGDNDQDVLITGRNRSRTPISKLYINDGSVSSKDHVSEQLRFEFKLYPNPSGVDKIKVSYTSKVNGSLTVNVFDLNGRLLSQQREKLGIGEHTFFIDIALLNRGSYIIQLDDGIRKGVRKFLVD